VYVEENFVWSQVVAHAWFGRLIQFMISMGYRHSQGDHTLFIKYSTLGLCGRHVCCMRW